MQTTSLGSILSHTKIKTIPRGQTKQSSRKGLRKKRKKKETGNTCVELQLGTGRPTEQPGTKIPGLGANLTLLVSTDTSLSATLGQRLQPSCQCCSGYRKQTARAHTEGRGGGDGCFCSAHGLGSRQRCQAYVTVNTAQWRGKDGTSNQESKFRSPNL